jgi:hypothetical protein
MNLKIEQTELVEGLNVSQKEKVNSRPFPSFGFDELDKRLSFPEVGMMGGRRKSRVLPLSC